MHKRAIQWQMVMEICVASLPSLLHPAPLCLQMVKPAERNTRYVDAVMTIPKVRSLLGAGSVPLCAAGTILRCCAPGLLHLI